MKMTIDYPIHLGVWDYDNSELLGEKIVIAVGGTTKVRNIECSFLVPMSAIDENNQLNISGAYDNSVVGIATPSFANMELTYECIYAQSADSGMPFAYGDTP